MLIRSCSRSTIFLTALLFGLLASNANAFTMFDTGVLGGNPESSLIGVTTTAADVGNSFDLGWVVANVVGTEDLTATGNFELLAFTDTYFDLQVTIANTTVLSSSLTNADILSLGFGVNPDATAAFLAGESGSVFDDIGDGSGPQQSYPGGFKGIDVCVYGQGCTGGAVAEGLHAGDTDIFQIRVTGDFSGGTADLLYFPIKFQTNVGSFEPGGGLIPEPSAALIFGVGLAFVAMRVRRTARLS
jgi:hypothetical protein